MNERSGYHLTAVGITVVYSDPEQVLEAVGGHTSDVERTNLTARQMNGRLLRKTLSHSKHVEALKAACACKDGISKLTRTVDTLSWPCHEGQQRWKPQTPAMAAGLTGHIWTVKELLMTVIPPAHLNT